MRIMQVTYQRTVQVRQYEPLQLSATAEVGEGEQAAAAVAALAGEVNAAIAQQLIVLRGNPRRDQRGDDSAIPDF